MPFPWARPRRELLLLALVGVAALTPIYRFGEQDRSRLCLTQAMAHGRVSNDSCLATALDRSSYGGHLYSDKAPGMSILQLPAAEALRLGPEPRWADEPLRIWGVRLLSSGIAFLACVWLVGRIAEGIAPRFGAPTLVAFGLGTLVAPLAATSFGHVTAAALGFGAFALAWRRRALAAGLLAGAALLFEYQAAMIAAIVGIYLAVAGVRPLLRYAAGALPGAALLAAYETAAFDRPWHLSYAYVANRFQADQAQGLFGIGAPHAFSTYLVFAGGGGLLVISPVVAAGAAGLGALVRRYPPEAVACIAVGIAFLALDCGNLLLLGDRTRVRAPAAADSRGRCAVGGCDDRAPPHLEQPAPGAADALGRHRAHAVRRRVDGRARRPAAFVAGVARARPSGRRSTDRRRGSRRAGRVAASRRRDARRAARAPVDRGRGRRVRRRRGRRRRCGRLSVRLPRAVPREPDCRRSVVTMRRWNVPIANRTRTSTTPSESGTASDLRKSRRSSTRLSCSSPG